MVKKLLKFSVILLIILGVSFSNVPFYALSKIIGSYVAGRNIVDNAWHISKDKNVVDKFVSWKNLPDKLKIQEARAATSYIGNSNIIYTNGGAPGAITPNVSTQDGDLLVFYHYSRAAGGNETVNLPGGFTPVFNSVTAARGLVAVGWRIKQAGDSTFQASVTNHTSGSTGETIIEFIQTYRGTDPTNPIVNYTASLSAWTTSLNIGPIAAPGTATVANGDTAVVFGGRFENVTGQTVLSGDSLTWAAPTTANTALGSDAGAVVQTGLNSSGSNQTVTQKTITTTGTTQAGAGRMFIIKAAPPPADSSPPTPNPMTWSSAPNNSSASQIDMTATTGSDATPPINYLFNNDNSSCGASAGTGGTASSWQSGTSYSDTGLQPNKCYGYTIQARDSVTPTPNTGTASGITSVYTSANTPGTPSLSGATQTTLNLTNAENSNPSSNPTTYFAVQVVTTSDGTWLNKWVDGSGNPSATAIWLTDAQLDALTLQGLQNATLYGVKVKARNQDNDETSLSAEGQGTTSSPPPVITVGTSGTHNQYLDSGTSAQYLGGAFTFSINTGSDTVNSITVSQNGTASGANLPNVRLYYDNGGGYGGGDDTLFGTGSFGSAISGSMTVTNGTTRSVYVVPDISSSASGGQTIDPRLTAAGVSGSATFSGLPADIGGTYSSVTIRPNVTSITYPITSPLNGSRIGQSITINGAGFGSTCDGTNNRVTLGGTGNVISCTGTTFTNTSITVTNFQFSSGDSYGAASSLLVRAGGTDDNASQDFYVYPDITDTTNPTAYTNAAREYSASDSDGIITINGNHFGSSQGSGSVTVLGQSATINSWTATAIQIRIPTTIDDATYTGNIVVTQGTGGSTSATDTYGSGIYRILPRIISTGPVNLKGGRNDSGVSISGNHLCQDASCSGSPEAAEDITFNSVSGKSGSTWSHTSITGITIPGTATDGNLVVTSDGDGAGTFTSNNLSYDVKFGPATPSGSSGGGSNNPALSGSVYSDASDSPADTHFKTQWQVAHNSDGDWSTPEWARTSGAAETGTTVNSANGTFQNSDNGQTELDCGVAYKGRVRYMDNGNAGADTQSWEWSAWSSDFTFTTGACVATLTIGATAGTKVSNADSGATSTYANSVSCNGPSSCAAFTLSLSSGSETITSIKITETGTADANNNLANLALFYDTDGNYANGVTGQYGSTVGSFTSEAATVSGSLAVSSGNTYYFYVRFDLVKSGTYPIGGQTVNFQIAADSDVGTSGSPVKTGAPATLAGTTTIRPNVTSITYPITSPLNGSRIGQSITINGAGFGSTCDGTNNRVTLGGTGNVISCTGTTFANTSITVTNFQFSSGDSYGAASSLLVRAGGTDDNASQDFYVYPDITDTTNPTAYTNAAREYSASDSDGIITINGNHFGSSQGSGSVTVLGQSVTINSWTATAIQIRIPTTIDDATYTGSIVVTQGTGGSTSATDTYGSGIYRILPRIISFNPSNPLIGNNVEIIGNHLCQNAGSCPSSLSSSNKIVFYNAVAAVTLNSWVNGNSSTNGVNVIVPSGAQVGDVVVTSNNYDSNALNLEIGGLAAPDAPANLAQYDDGIVSISTGGGDNDTTLFFEGDISAPSSITMVFEAEAKPVNTAFDGSSLIISAPQTGTSFADVQISTSSLSDGVSYHWRARTRNTANNAVSSWVAFGNNPAGDGTSDGSPASVDFYIDASGPSISATTATNITDTGADITWSTNESANRQVAYGASCPSGQADAAATFSALSSKMPGSPTGSGTSHSVSLTGLDANTIYYYMVRSMDGAGNSSYDPSSANTCKNFQTDPPVTRVMKTVNYFAAQVPQITEVTTTVSSFSAQISEDSPTIKNAYVEITGIVKGASPTITAQVNSQASLGPVSLPDSTSGQPFKIRYNLSNLTTAGCPTAGANICVGAGQNNDLSLTFGGTFTAFSLVDAKIVLTYFYTP